MARSFGRNVILSVASWVVPTVVAFFAIPVTVRGLGDDAYGVIALAGAVAGYIAVLDLGLNLGVVRYVSMFARLRQGRAMRQLLWWVTAWFTLAGVFGAAAMWVLAPWLVGSLIAVPPSLAEQAVEAFRLAGVAFGISMLAAVLSVVPEAFLRYDIVSVLTIATASLSLGGPAVLVMLGQGLVPIMWFSVGVSLLACVCWGAVAMRLVAEVPESGPGFSEYRREFAGFCKFNAVNRVFSVIQNPTSRLIVGIAGGTAQAAYYQVPLTLSAKVTELLLRMNVVLLPTGSQLAADGGHGPLVDLYMRSSRVFYVVNASVVCALVVFSDPLLRFWVGEQFADEGATALALLALAAGLNAVGMTAGHVNYALGRPGVNLAFSLVNSAINLGTLYFLTVSLGIAGTALSALLAAAVVPFALGYSHRNVLEVSSWGVFRDCYLRTTLAVAVVGALSWVLLRPVASGLPSTLLLTALVTMASVGATAAFGALTAQDWSSMRSILRSTAGPQPSRAVSTVPEEGGFDD